MTTRRELLEAVSARYRGGARAERSRILDEFAAVTGYHRKHAIRLLAGLGKRKEADGFGLPARACARTYGVEVRDALIQLWEVADRVCSKRLRPMLPALLPALERHGRVALDEARRAKLLAVSAASIDRLLADVRAVAGGGRRRPVGFGSAVRRSVPVRTFNDWGDPAPGWVEVDVVAHGGTTVSGAFAQTMVLTDIATGWTECIPIVVREAEMVVHALGRARELFPFPLRGVDFDNDSLFMNDLVVGWCRAEGLEVTRSRAYRKNDQAWVEQKNGAIVCRLVGYGWFEGVLAGEALGRLYAAARLHGNLFQPSFKLREKRREGAGDQALPCAGAAGDAGASPCGGVGRGQGAAAEHAGQPPIRSCCWPRCMRHKWSWASAWMRAGWELAATVATGSKAAVQIGTELNVTGDSEMLGNIPS